MEFEEERKGSIRAKRMSALLREEISRIICYELKDPRICAQNLCTVTRVKMALDMKSASVNVSVLGKVAEQRRVLTALQHASSYIQSRLSHILKLRHTPVLTFFLDHSIEKSIRVSHIIDECAREIEEKEKSKEIGSSSEQEDKKMQEEDMEQG
jgi:ribosome-binding factor A